MRGEEGFTLIEALVAMAVLSVGAVTLLTATERHSSISYGVSERVMARWAAENRLTAVRAGLSSEDGAERIMGRDWPVSVTVGSTADPDLMRIDVVAGPADAPVRLMGFADATALEAGR